MRRSSKAILALLSLQLAVGCTASSDAIPGDEDPGAGDPTGDGVGVDDQSIDDGKADAVTDRYKLHFFPKLRSWDGHDEQTGVLMVARDGKYIFAAYVRGGPAVKQGTASRTPMGTYRVAGVGPKLGSSRWPMSLAQWGSTLSVDQNAAGQVTAVYQHSVDLAGKTVTRKIEDWKLSWVNTQDFDGPVGLVFGDTNKNGKIEPDEKTVDNMWLGDYVSSSAPIYKNDFGHMAVDLGANSVFIHTTPTMYLPESPEPRSACSSLSGECELADSHGCLHVAPATIDYILSQGWIRKGTAVVVHSYTENAPADAQRLLATLDGIDPSAPPAERVAACACDWRKNVCEVAIPGTSLECTCDIDCFQ